MNKRKPQQPKFERRARHGLDEFNAPGKHWREHRLPEHTEPLPATKPNKPRR